MKEQFNIKNKINIQNVFFTLILYIFFISFILLENHFFSFKTFSLIIIGILSSIISFFNESKKNQIFIFFINSIIFNFYINNLFSTSFEEINYKFLSITLFLTTLYSLIYFKISNYINELIKNQEEESNLNKAIYYAASNLSNSNNPDLDDIFTKICYYTGFDRLSIYILDDKRMVLDKSLNLLNSNILLPKEIFIDKGMLNELNSIKDVHIHDELGTKEIIAILKKQIKTSFVYVPILTKDKDFFGFFLFESINHEKIWNYDNLKILKIISYSYSSYIGRKRAEELAENSAKLSALGEISAGIAHEINNPLAIIHGQSNIIKFLIEDSQKNNKSINLNELNDINNLLLETVERTDKIVNGLRYFVRNDDNNPFIKTDLDNILDTVQILSIDRCKKSGIIVSIEKHNIPKNFEFECKPTQIAQVLINLINNSFDAIKNLNIHDQKKWIKIVAELKKDQLILSIIDCGSGIPEEVGEKILQKFYTTKKYSKFSGSGLGLNISKRIVEMHHGHLKIDYMHKNTKFDVLLPLIQPK